MKKLIILLLLSGCATQSNPPEPPPVIDEQTHRLIKTHKRILQEQEAQAKKEKPKKTREKISTKCVKADWIREGVFLTLLAIDWGQTLDIVKREDEGFSETNPILGHHPSRAKVNTLIGAVAIGHPIVACKFIKSPKWRKWFQYITIGAEGYAVIHNYNIGLKVNF